jgi:curved DNA-binding protein CbpA
VRAWKKHEVLAYLERIEPVLDKLDYFELLDVRADADADQITEAFHAVAGGIHPDRLRKSLSAEQKERLTIVYARIAEAYRVLRDPGLRDAYVRDQARVRPDVAGEVLDLSTQLAQLSPKAQTLYRKAQAALRTGDRTSAVLNLRMALSRHPQSSLLRDALARAQQSDKPKP